jgi:hypothetical protein
MIGISPPLNVTSSLPTLILLLCPSKQCHPFVHSYTTLPLVLHFITTLNEVLDWGFWYALELLQSAMFEQDIGRDYDLLTFNLKQNMFCPCKHTRN